nr:MAG TPA: Protein of unknown function (DUF551) [Caudoviricetes sp.]
MTNDEIVKALRENADKNTCRFACEECDEADCLTPAFRAAADLIEQQAAKTKELEAKVPRWIPVTEKIPPDQEEVLVLTRSKNGVRNVDKGYWAIDHFIHRGRAEVTHWMPLPEGLEDGT